MKTNFLFAQNGYFFSVLGIQKESKQILENIWWKKIVAAYLENLWTYVVGLELEQKNMDEPGEVIRVYWKSIRAISLALPFSHLNKL